MVFTHKNIRNLKLLANSQRNSYSFAWVRFSFLHSLHTMKPSVVKACNHHHAAIWLMQVRGKIKEFTNVLCQNMKLNKI